MCPKCKTPVPANEAACYHGYHEDCAVGTPPATNTRAVNADRAMPAWAYQTAAMKRALRLFGARKD